MNGQKKVVFDLGGLSPFKYFFSLAFVLGVLFALISHGTAAQDHLMLDFFQWQLQTLIPIVILISLHWAMSHWSPFERIGRWKQLVISGLLGALIFTPMALLIDWWREGMEGTDSLASALIGEFMGMAPPVVISWVAMNAPWVLGYQVTQPKPKDADTNQRHSDKSVSTEHEVLPQLLRPLLPMAIHAPIVSLSAELHYVSVETEKGSAMVLLNLKDAVKSLAGSKGIQTHRSHWVNLNHVKQVKKKGRQGTVVLSSGREIPVSRQRLKSVLDAHQKNTASKPAAQHP